MGRADDVSVSFKPIDDRSQGCLVETHDLSDFRLCVALAIARDREHQSVPHIAQSDPAARVVEDGRESALGLSEHPHDGGTLGALDARARRDRRGGEVDIGKHETIVPTPIGRIGMILFKIILFMTKVAQKCVAPPIAWGRRRSVH